MRSLLAGVALLFGNAGLLAAAPMISVENFPAVYTPGQNFSFQVRLSDIVNLNSYSIDLTLQAAQGTAGVNFQFNDALTAPPGAGYVFPSTANFFANSGVNGNTATINLSDFLPAGGVDVMPGVNDIVANVVVSTQGLPGALTIGFDPSFTELLDPNQNPVTGGSPVISPPVTITQVPEPASMSVWLIAAAGASIAHLRRRKRANE